MAHTKKLISDSVLYKLAGGVPDAGYPVDERDVWDSLENKVNALFKMEQFTVNLKSGGTIPENLAIATYEDVTVTRTFNNKSKATLPVIPISLPLNAGIHEIRPVLNTAATQDQTLGNPFIPLISGQDFLLQADTLLNDLMGQIGYTPQGKTVYFSKDITLFGITDVVMKLIVLDISQYGINDTLPIPADYINQIENELIMEFAPVASENGYVNVWSNIGQTAPNNANTQTK